MTRLWLERYLAVLRAEMGGAPCPYAGGLSGFLKTVRRHGWDDTLPATAAIYPGDFPARGDEHGQPVHLTPHQWRHTLGRS